MSRKPKHQALVAVSQYLTDEVERGVSFYETQAQKIDGRYLAQVEKLATRTKAKDSVLAQFFRDTVQPGSIASAKGTIRFRLRTGRIVEAHMGLKRLGRNLEFIDQHLAQPIFRMGAKFYGERGPRRDAITRLIDEALNELGRKASAKEVLDQIRAAPSIQDIDFDGTISWRNARGEERTTTFRTFQNRVADRRKLFSTAPQKI
jgi:hypothetical protein